MSRPVNLPGMLFEQARQRPDALAIRYKHLGIWHRVTWRQYADEVRRVAAALLAFGLARRENVAVLGENCPAWLYCHLGIMAAGGATVGVYPTSSPEQVQYLLTHSGARLIFVENEEQLEKVLAVLPGTRVERVVVWDEKGLWGFDDPRVVFLGTFLREGEALLSADPARLEARLDEVEGGDTAMIIYTSGTTGPPKGAMLSHANCLFMSESLLERNAAVGQDELVSYLPLAHVYENLGSVMQHARMGYVVNFVESMDTLFQNLREVSPTYFASVPRIWEKLASTIELRIEDSTWLKRTLYRLAVSVGRRWARARRAGKVPFHLAAARFATYWLVFEPLKRRIGFDRIRLALSGAAPAAPELFEYFQALGIPLIEGYGMTESSGVIAVNRQEAPLVGTVGEPIQGIEVKLDEDGEICTRGPHVFQGYFKDPEQTARAVDPEGWLHTGDVGEWQEGRLKIVDRKKDILITAGGKNIAPAWIENKLKFSPYIQDAVVIGDRRKFLVALILIDEDNVTKFAQDHRLPFATFQELTQAPEVTRLVAQEVSAVNRTLSQVESVKKFALLPRRFYEEEGDVTPTKKVKRRNIEKRYAEMVEALYRD
ncbi:MAG TPA: long-chain fatty acid--CoA ligase [Anaeromyxobacteraceae bacterium]|nr:long-chain fatty acid--CoA ligase [Anaeromyxobacteraceae bacterium]